MYFLYMVLLHVLYLYTEILEAFNSLSVPTMATEFTATEINNLNSTDSQQFSRYITPHDISSASSMKHTTASVINITQPPQCEY